MSYLLDAECEICGSTDDVWENASGELECENCGWQEGE